MLVLADRSIDSWYVRRKAIQGSCVGSRWVLGIFYALFVFTACTAEAADTTTVSTSTTSSANAPTTLAETTTTLVGQDPDEAVDVVRELLGAVMAKDQTAIVELVEVPGEMRHTTDQLRNVFKFAVATSWLDGVSDCSGEPSESESGIAVVSCSVSSWHPLFGFPDEERVWNLQVHGGAVVGADPAPISTEDAEEFLAWLKGERSTVTDLMCGADAYESSEVVIEIYPIHPRCGSYLTEQMGEYFASTDPDHPVAVWHSFSEAWNDRRFQEVMSLFAERAVLDTGPNLFGTYTGRDEIRNWVEFEFEEYTDSVTYFEDFEVEGSALRMISSWTNRAGLREGFRSDLAVIEDGLIQRLEFGETPTPR